MNEVLCVQRPLGSSHVLDNEEREKDGKIKKKTVKVCGIGSFENGNIRNMETLTKYRSPSDWPRDIGNDHPKFE